MPNIFVFIRHAEAEHNLAFHESNKDPMIFYKKELKDSKLTDNGKKQAINLAKHLTERYPKVEAIWSSSLQRCIQTADEIFEEVNVKEYYLHDNLIERQTPGYYFNYRTEKKILIELYGHINMGYIPEFPALWNVVENNHVLRSRIYMLMMLILDLYKGCDDVIMIVGHSDAIEALTKKKLKNAEYIEMSEEEVRGL